MGKLLRSERTSAGMGLFSNFVDHVRTGVRVSKKLYGRASAKTILLRRILAIISYATKGYCTDEALLGSDGAVRTKVLSNVNLMFCGQSQGTDLSAYDQLVEALLQRADAYRKEGNRQSHRSALVLGLMAVTWCVTTGSHKTSSGERLLTRLRFFFRLYGTNGKDWEWIVDHADLQRNDFVGLLSVVLTKTEIPTEQELAAVNAGRLEGKVA